MSRTRRQTPQTLLVSFSGIDGAGKSTQISNLCNRLDHNRVSFRLVVFWDEVATLTRLREWSSHTLFKGDRGAGTPDRPISRRDKNVQSWYMTALRYFLYFLDAVSLRWMVTKARQSGAQVIIFDRYLYDEVANLSPDDRATRTFLRLLLKIAPRPDIAFLLDADPAEAYQRKPEYPIEFLQYNRASFLATSDVTAMTVIPPLPATKAAEKVLESVSRNLALVPVAENASYPSRASNFTPDTPGGE